MDFIPIGFDVFGALGLDATRALNQIGLFAARQSVIPQRQRYKCPFRGFALSRCVYKRRRSIEDARKP